MRYDRRSLGTAVTVAAKGYRVTPYLLGTAAMLLALSDLSDDPQERSTDPAPTSSESEARP